MGLKDITDAVEIRWHKYWLDYALQRRGHGDDALRHFQIITELYKLNLDYKKSDEQPAVIKVAGYTMALTN